MYKRDKSYDGTVLHGLVPMTKSEPSKKERTLTPRPENIKSDDQKLCSKFAESSRYFVGEAVLRSALINQHRTKY